jgi:hypothetical protein
VYAPDFEVKLVVRMPEASRTYYYFETVDELMRIHGRHNSNYCCAKALTRIAWLECFCSNCQHCSLLQAPSSWLDMVSRNPSFTNEGSGAMIRQVKSNGFCLVSRALENELKEAARMRKSA